MHGTVKMIREDKCFGFVACEDHGDDAFFHASDLQGDLEFNERLLERRVEFSLEVSAKGRRARAVQAT